MNLNYLCRFTADITVSVTCECTLLKRRVVHHITEDQSDTARRRQATSALGFQMEFRDRPFPD